jgi:hypothetical protein
VLAFCDNSNEALAGMLRPGNAGSNTAADLIAVLDAALAQIPDEFRHGYPMLVRTDGAGASNALLAHTRGLREHRVHTEFSVGWAVTEREHAAIAALPETAWTPAIDIHGDPRDHAAVAELTGLLPTSLFAGYPPGMRVIVRRERPHPGAQLDLIETRDGATPASPPTPRPGSTPGSMPGTAPTPASRTAPDAARTPAWASCPRRSSRSTKPGWPAR